MHSIVVHEGHHRSTDISGDRYGFFDVARPEKALQQIELFSKCLVD
jgi:hypothetical protein